MSGENAAATGAAASPAKSRSRSRDGATAASTMLETASPISPPLLWARRDVASKSDPAADPATRVHKGAARRPASTTAGQKPARKRPAEALA